jgi:small-conductance mechanosensitive channel
VQDDTAAQDDTSTPDAVPLSVGDASETIMQTLNGIWIAFLGHLPLILAGFLVLVATAVAAMATRRITRRIFRERKLRRSLKALFERIISIGTWVVGLLLAAMVVFPGVEPADALAALGLGSLAVGLAFRDIFENFFAGILILWRFPFEVDDFIECNGLMGRVEDVTIRNTMIRTVDGKLVVVPNASIYKNPVEVLTSRVVRRMSIICGVAYSEDLAQARLTIKQSLASCHSVSTHHPVEIFAQEFADSGVNFEITWWTGSTPLEQRSSCDEVVEAVKDALDSAGIEIPFPYRTLTFKEPLQMKSPAKES